MAGRAAQSLASKVSQAAQLSRSLGGWKLGQRSFCSLPTVRTAQELAGVLAGSRVNGAAVVLPRVLNLPLDAFAQARGFSSDISSVPSVSDPAVEAALDALLASSWTSIGHITSSDVTHALRKSKDEKSTEVLANAWRAAIAVEEFSGKLASLRAELDELSGGKFGGDKVRQLSHDFEEALSTALNKYVTYLAAFDPDEDWLKKKVEMELGGVLLQVKQRVCGLDPAWAKITLLGTSGLSGSYIEKRSLNY